MGRQIQFFMVNEDENEFINKVFESGDYFIDNEGNKATANDIKNSPYDFWIVSVKSRIVKRKIGRIDDDRVDGIQFVRSTIKEPNLRKTEEDIEKDKEDILDFEKELKKIVFPRIPIYYPPLVDKETLDKYRSQKRIEPGRLWVQLKYYSSYDANAQIISKDKWLEDKYNYYKRWIIKNSKISKDKKSYIGKETYVLYKEAGYKMMGGPILEIEFD